MSKNQCQMNFYIHNLVHL